MRMTTKGGGRKGGRPPGGKVISIGSNGFAKLKALPVFKDVHQKLIDGWPLAELARWIQQDQKLYTDITKDGLVSVLSKYRAAIPAAEFAKNRPDVPAAVVDKIREIEEGLNELSEMEKLYNIQMERVEIDRQMEKNIKKLLPTMGQEIRTAKEILQAYADLKMDLGLVDRNLGTTRTETITATLNLGSDSSSTVKKVLENPESRRKLTAIAQRFLVAAKETPKQEVSIDDADLGSVIEGEISASFDGEPVAEEVTFVESPPEPQPAKRVDSEPQPPPEEPGFDPTDGLS